MRVDEMGITMQFTL